MPRRLQLLPGLFFLSFFSFSLFFSSFNTEKNFQEADMLGVVLWGIAPWAEARMVVKRESQNSPMLPRHLSGTPGDARQCVRVGSGKASGPIGPGDHSSVGVASGSADVPRARQRPTPKSRKMPLRQPG
jgi:hypothetical protein